MALLYILFTILYFVAWYQAMTIICMASTEKGYPELTGKLWFIGLFGLIFTPAIIVAALPDKKSQVELMGASSGSAAVPSIEDELPEL